MQNDPLLSLHTGEQLTALVLEKDELMQDTDEPRSMLLTFPALYLRLPALVRHFPEGSLVVLMQKSEDALEMLRIAELYAKGVEWAQEKFHGLYHNEYFLIQQLNNQLVDSKRALARTNSRLRQLLGEVEQTNAQLEQARSTAVRAMQLAEQASRSKTEFLANMSHDIRTPMNAIVGLTELMEHEIGASPKMQRYLDKLRTTSNHLLDMLSDVLSISKIESGSITLREETVDLAAQLRQISAVIRPQVQEHGHRLVITASHLRHDHFLGDATRLRQIFVNLLSNAVKYTPDGGHITFSMREEAGEDEMHAVYHFSVQDDGIGMTPEFQKHIFEPFSRSEQAQSSQIQGTGLGMAITHSFAQMMGGSLRVESVPGEGSTFELVLPVTLVSAEIAAQNLLLIGFPPDCEREIRYTVQGTPVQCTAVPDCETAAKLLRGGDVNAVLLFCGGGTDGLRENAALLRDAASADTLLFGVSALTDGDPSGEITDAGMDGFLPLPFFLSALAHETRHILEHRQAPAAAGTSLLRGMNLLCAEDNELNAEILRTLLEIAGARCTVCENGRILVDTFEKSAPGEYDLILTDMRMPVMDGCEAAQLVRASAHPDAKRIPILAMTANVFAEDIQRCLDSGMNAHLSKPVNIDALEAEIRRLRRK